jgi:hypothetical protein
MPAAVGVGSAGFPDAGGFSATAGGFSETAFSTTADADLSVKEGDGFDGCRLGKEPKKAPPAAIQTATMKTTPAVRTAF